MVRALWKGKNSIDGRERGEGGVYRKKEMQDKKVLQPDTHQRKNTGGLWQYFTDRQTPRQTSQRNRQTDRKSRNLVILATRQQDRQTEKETDRQTDQQTHRTPAK